MEGLLNDFLVYFMSIFCLLIIPLSTFIAAILNYRNSKKATEEEKAKYKSKTLLYGFLCLFSTSVTVWLVYTVYSAINYM